MAKRERLDEMLALALAGLVAEIAKRDGEGNTLPEHLPAMRDAAMALDVWRRMQAVEQRAR